MPTRARNEVDAIERLRREKDAGGARYVDLRLDFELPCASCEHCKAKPRREDLCTSAQRVFHVGGRWDRRLADYDGTPSARVVVRMHKGQVRAAEWFKQWLDAHADRRVSPPAFDFEGDLEAFELDSEPSHAYSAMFAGGRRGGKTWIAVACAVVYAVMYPGAIVWIVSPNDQKHSEVRRYMKVCVADEWLDRQTSFEYDLCNGSQILLKGAHDPDLLKEGKANLIILNEGQLMKERAFTVARGNIVDSSGIVIVCANPPVEKKDQVWVSDFAAEAQAGQRAAVYLHFNPLDNHHIDRRALMSMRADLDERTFRIEVLGEFLGPADAVAWNWDRLENELAPNDPRVARLAPELVDVTEWFLSLAGEGEGILALPGVDFQTIPHIGGPIYKFYAPPRAMPTIDNVLAWIVDEVVLDGGDEVDYCDALREKGYEPASTLIVGDATGEYQHTRRRNTDSPPPEWKGRGSFSIIRGEGYHRIKPPDRRLKGKNPPIVDRMRAFTSMICSGTGIRRLFADPLKAPRTCDAIRKWRVVHGKPSRTQEEAHLGDGASYPIVRIFPRRLRAEPGAGNPRDVKDPVEAKVDKSAAPIAADDFRIAPKTSGRRGDRTRGM